MDPLILLQFSEKLLPHLMHLYGFSPVWFISWIVTWYGKAPETSMVSFLHGPSNGTFQVFGSWEALATRYAFEWLLSSVIPFMNLHLMWKSSSHIWCTSMVESFSHFWCTWIPSVYFSKLMSSTYKKLQYYNTVVKVRRARSTLYFIRHKSGYKPEMNRKTGNLRPPRTSWGSKDSKKP